MPLEIVRNDITKMLVDVIVNPTNTGMFGISGIDGLIHEIEGESLRKKTTEMGLCPVGEARLTKSNNMPSDYIIHTVGPIWIDGSYDEVKDLSNCFINSLELALSKGFNSIAFPLIASGTFGFPKDKVLNIAMSTIGEFLLKHDMMVYLVVYDKTSFKLSEKLFSRIDQYIDDYYIEDQLKKSFVNEEVIEELSLNVQEEMFEPVAMRQMSQLRKSKIYKRKLEDVINSIEETFSQMLLRLITEKDLKDSEVYKKANVDRKLFSKIRNNIEYKPSKQTVLAFAIALELNIDQSKDMLLKAGYALSSSSKFDLIIKFFIEEEDYNIFKLNEALYAFDQNTLGV